MRESFGVDRKIQFVLDTEKVELDVIQAAPLGLILNEAISNAIKYAFPGDRKGEVRISLHTSAAPSYPPRTTGAPSSSLQDPPRDICRLVIADNGIGLPPGFDPENFGSLGMRLVSVMMLFTARLKLQIRLIRGKPFQQIFAVFHYRCLFRFACQYNDETIRILSLPQD